MKLLNVILGSLIIILYFLPVKPVFAQSGCCSWHGGESYCDYTTNRWVCADGTFSPTCTCGGGYAGSYQTPTCPLNSYWTGSSCSCYAGYISSGGACISYQQYCWNTLGYSSTYNYGTGRCECMSGNVYSGGTCISGITYCTNNYGIDSQFNYATKSCECISGYDWNSSRTQCVSKDDICHNQLGLMSWYNSLTNTCDCFTGYSIIGGQCLPTPKRVYVPQQASNTENNTVSGTNSHNDYPSDTPIPTSKPSPTPMQLVAGSSKSFTYLGDTFLLIAIGTASWLLILKLQGKKVK